MQRFSQISMLLPAAAMLVSIIGCNAQPEVARCVDDQYIVVPNRFCQSPSERIRVRGSIYPVAQYRPYYGGYGGDDPGSKAWGGSDYPLRGHAYQTHATEDARSDGSGSVSQDFYIGANHTE